MKKSLKKEIKQVSKYFLDMQRLHFSFQIRSVRKK